MIPIVNVPAVPVHSEFVCPIDGRNINFSFPGDPQGSFSEALADALLNEWAGEAECLIDLHGGDIREMVSRFTVAPLIGDPAFDNRTLELAAAFAPDILVTLTPDQSLRQNARSCCGRVQQRRYAAFAEAGGNGLIDEASVSFQVDGVLRIAALLGMIESAPPLPAREPVMVDQYHWVVAGDAGWCVYRAEPGQAIARGQTLAEIFNYAGCSIGIISSPAAGHVLWRCTHPLVTAETQLFGIGAAGMKGQERNAA
jgi:predicted deacylase